MKQYAQMLDEIEHTEIERDMYKEECEKLKHELELQKKLYEDLRLERDALQESDVAAKKLILELFLQNSQERWSLPWFLDTFRSKSDA